MTVRNFEELLSGMNNVFESGRTRAIQWRRTQLIALGSFLGEHEKEIADAVYADFRKSGAETYFTETGFLLAEIRFALKHLGRWMRPEYVPVPLYYQFSKSYVLREPLGVVLVVGAWNYPINLCIAPLIGALAGGNCVVVKPSERTPNSSRIIAEGLHRYLDSDAVRIVNGGPEETELLLRERFDHIFFTGSRDKGREIMQAAARHLTPVTLELGGKCPCVVMPDWDLRTAARRIVWAKFLNGGQTCIAPDYVLVHESAEEKLLGFMQEAIGKFYGSNPKESADYPRIIDERHYLRLCRFLGQGKIVEGGDTDERELYIAPTIIRGVSTASPVMQEEIFGPVLPVLSFSLLDQAIGMIRSGAEPLAIYLFSADKEDRRKVMDRTKSGGLCINDLLFHASVSGLPFGGTGRSGMGSYHGRAGFETFTVRKSVMLRSRFPDFDLRYPPYGKWKFGFLKRLLTWLS